jgi:hypothetical protein
MIRYVKKAFERVRQLRNVYPSNERNWRIFSSSDIERKQNIRHNKAFVKKN